MKTLYFNASSLKFLLQAPSVRIAIPGLSLRYPFPPPSPQDWKENTVNMVIQRIFGSSTFRPSSHARTVNRLSIEQIQERLRSLLHD